MASFVPTPPTLLSRLQDEDGAAQWQLSWKRFVELYHAPLYAVAHACYRKHTNGQAPSHAFVEDIIATVVAEFFSREHQRYDAQRGRLRDFLRTLTNRRVVDALRKQKPLNHQPYEDQGESTPPSPSPDEAEAFNQALLGMLIEDLRGKIPHRCFEIFELVKLKNIPPQAVADDLGINRARVDREIYKAMTTLRELANHHEYQEEYYS